MSHAQLIDILKKRDIPVSPFMEYWTLDELRRYLLHHVQEALIKHILP